MDTTTKYSLCTSKIIELKVFNINVICFLCTYLKIRMVINISEVDDKITHPYEIKLEYQKVVIVRFR